MGWSASVWRIFSRGLNASPLHLLAGLRDQNGHDIVKKGFVRRKRYLVSFCMKVQALTGGMMVRTGCECGAGPLGAWAEPWSAGNERFPISTTSRRVF